ncbi:glycosyltransferase family 2 protein [Candidatus Pacearchaeota archaeon]|nr:glycosyltransferase family 2 protein [Candidatus Pacearchaeota archaeon]
MKFLPVIYLMYMFVSLYFTSFFLILYFKNKNRLFYYPHPNRKYSVSVLIPAKNEQDTIGKTIECILASDYPLKEVIIINDGSTDRTAEVVKAIMRKNKIVKLLTKPNSGKADSVNQGIKMSKGELFVVLDADGYPQPDAISKMVGFFNDKNMAAVTSLILPKNRESFIGKLQSFEYPIIAWTRKLLGYVDSIYVTPGALSMYNKEIIVNLGGFDKTNMTEDIELTWRLAYYGYKRDVSLSARDYTVVPETLGKWWKQRTRWNLGGLQTIMKYKQFFFRRGMLGFFIIPFFITSLFLGLLGIGIFTYLSARRIIFTYLITDYSFIANTPLLTINEFYITPSVLNIFGVALFLMGLFFTYFGILSVREKGIIKIQNLFNLLFYLIVYLTVYPLIMISSVYKYVKRDIGWGTK